jgi:hypothetical protein
VVLRAYCSVDRLIDSDQGPCEQLPADRDVAAGLYALERLLCGIESVLPCVTET